MTLCELAEKYGTNKCEYGYTPVYTSMFAPRSIKRLLELGIGAPGLSGGPSRHAASLKMWRAFLPDAEIFAVDVRREILINEDRITSHWADMNDSATLVHAAEYFGGDFDVIVDDAVHLPEAQILGMLTLLPFLSPSGMYFIEDVANCDPMDIVDAAPSGYDCHVWKCRLPFVMIQRRH